MSLIFILLGVIIYAIIGNLIVRFLHAKQILELSESLETDFFVLGIFIPFVLLYMLISNVSFYIFSKIMDYYDTK